MGDLRRHAGLQAELMPILKQQCAAIGFEKRAQIYFTRDLTPDTIGVLAFVFNQRMRIVSLSVAVRHQPLERLLAELAGEDFHPYLSGTLTCPLGHVPPLNELTWYEIRASR